MGKRVSAAVLPSLCTNEFRCHIPQSPIVLASAGHLGLSLTVRLTLSSMFQCPRAIPLETSLICILLSVSCDVYFDKRRICFLSGLF